MSEYRTGDPVCSCGTIMTAGKPWCPIHDNLAGSPPADTEASGGEPEADDNPDTPEHWWFGCSKHYKRLEELSKEFPEQRKDLWAAAVCVSMAGVKIMELFKRIDALAPSSPSEGEGAREGVEETKLCPECGAPMRLDPLGTTEGPAGTPGDNVYLDRWYCAKQGHRLLTREMVRPAASQAPTQEKNE